MGILGLCANNTAIALNKARAFISGYQKQHIINEQEINCLQLFTEYAAISLSYWRFWMYNIHSPIPEKSHTYNHMVQLAKNIRSIPRDEFTGTIFA